MKFQQIKESLGEDADVMEQDHEVQMARADCFHAAKNAIELHRILKGISERQGLEGWVSEKITLAADYLRTVKEYLEYEEGRNQTVDFDKTDYNTVLDSYLGESRVIEVEEKGLSQKEIERKINTPNLSARARELLIKAFGQFPQAKNEIDAIVNYLEAVKNTGETNITRLDKENRQQDTSIDQLEKENTSEIQQIQRLEQELQKIKQRSMARTQPVAPGAPATALEEMSAGATGVGGIAAAPAQNLFKKPVKRVRK